MTNDHGRLPLSYATEHVNEAVVKMLVAWDNVGVNTKDDHGCSLLSYATKDGDEAMVKILVAQDDAYSGAHQV